MIVFETDRLIVRDYDFELDADDFFRLNGDEEIMRYIRPAKNREECDIFLQEIIARTDPEGTGRWAAIEKESGEFVGSFAIIPIENTDLIQLGYALLKNSWGKGYASELTKSGLKYYFSITDASEIYAVAETANVVSQRVLVKNGFVFHSKKIEGDKELQQFIYTKENFRF